MANMMTLIKKVILGSGVQRSMLNGLTIPDDVPDMSVNEANLSEWLAAVTVNQQCGHLLIATNSEQIAALSRSLNMNFAQNKLAIWCGGNLDLSDMQQEMKLRMLYTADKKEYLPEPLAGEHVFRAENRVMIRTEQAPPNADLLYTYDGKPWGVMLNSDVCADSYAGTLQELLPALPEHVRACLLPMLYSKGENCPSAEDILMFRKENGYSAFPAPAAGNVNTDELALYIMTGLRPDAPADIILRTLSRLNDTETAERLCERFCSGALFA